MEVMAQILITSLNTGAMYALAAVGLSLVFGTLGMFNMAHGVFMMVTAYAAFALASAFAIPVALGVVFAAIVGAAVGALTYILVVRFMIGRAEFGTTIIIATAGLAILLEDLVLKSFGAYPFPQPLSVEGSVVLLNVAMPLQTMVNLAIAMTAIVLLAFTVFRTNFGRAIRATAMNFEAAKLMGVQTDRVFLQVMALAGALAGVAGLMISTVSTLSPQMGSDPLLKAFVICVVAGLGNVWGAGICALCLAFVEALVNYTLGARFGFPVVLGLVIFVLIWRPAGLFGKNQVVRL